MDQLIFRDSDIIELSDSSDSVDGLITAIRELEQKKLETNFVAEDTTIINLNEKQQREGKNSRNVTLSEKDINELKNNPLIMFNGYR